MGEGNKTPQGKPEEYIQEGFFGTKKTKKLDEDPTLVKPLHTITDPQSFKKETRPEERAGRTSASATEEALEEKEDEADKRKIPPIVNGINIQGSVQRLLENEGGTNTDKNAEYIEEEDSEHREKNDQEIDQIW